MDDTGNEELESRLFSRLSQVLCGLFNNSNRNGSANFLFEHSNGLKYLHSRKSFCARVSGVVVWAVAMDSRRWSERRDPWRMLICVNL